MRGAVCAALRTLEVLRTGVRAGSPTQATHGGAHGLLGALGMGIWMGCGTVAWCEYGGQEQRRGPATAGATLSWGQLVARMIDHDVTHCKRTTAHGARYELSLRAAPGADMHAVLVALLAAFGCDEGARVSAADAPSSTALTVSAGPYTLEVNVPRVRAFDAHVALVVEARGAIEPSFTEGQLRALQRAASVAAVGGVTPTPTSRPALTPGGFDSLTILDETGNPFACRNPRVNEAEAKETNARNKLRELGVEVMDVSEMTDTFDSLAGYEEVKQRIENALVLPLKHPEVFARVVQGTRESYKENVPRAVLLSGPPGCGKTASARILAKAVGVPFVHVPLEGLLSKYYGETTRRLAELLEACDALGRCIVFVDEVDSLAGDRSGEVHEVSRRTLSVLLKFLDGIDGPRNAVMLAATNCPDDVDAALLSRFDVVLEFPYPDVATRAKILALYARHLSPSEHQRIAEAADGFSGRELLDICEEAERTHAGRLVRNEAREGSLPTVGLYMQAVKAKSAMSVSRVEQRKESKRRRRMVAG